MKALRLVRFRGFLDSGWIEFRPLTLLFGHNSSGKSSILAAMLMLRQSLLNPDRTTPFLFTSDEGIDLGTFEDTVFEHKWHPQEPIEIHLRIGISDPVNEWPFLEREELNVQVGIGFDRPRRTLCLQRYRIYDTEEKTILDLRRTTPRPEGALKVKSDFFPGRVPGHADIRWNHFLPEFPESKEVHPSLVSLNRSVGKEINERLMDLIHIGPLRTEPSRFYYFSGESAASVGERGESTYKLLAALEYQGRTQELQTGVNKWLKRLGYSLEPKMIGKSPLIQIGVREDREEADGFQLNLVDVGFGISQVLPLLVQFYGSERGRSILLEQPELHLHPRAQAELGDLLREATALHRLVVETHSEHLLLRLRRRIAEYGAGLRDDSFDPDNLAVYFVERSDARSSVTPIGFDELGQLRQAPESFRQFFSDDYEETLKIQKLIAEGQKRKQERE